MHEKDILSGEQTLKAVSVDDDRVNLLLIEAMSKV